VIGDAAWKVLVYVAADFRGSGGDALACGQDCGAGLGTRVAACLGLRAGEGVFDPDAVAGAGDEGDGVCFGFANSLTAGRRVTRRDGSCVAQEDMSELMR
jgi:hypothetical protein